MISEEEVFVLDQTELATLEGGVSGIQHSLYLNLPSLQFQSNIINVSPIKLRNQYQ